MFALAYIRYLLLPSPNLWNLRVRRGWLLNSHAVTLPCIYYPLKNTEKLSTSIPPISPSVCLCHFYAFYAGHGDDGDQ